VLHGDANLQEGLATHSSVYPLLAQPFNVNVQAQDATGAPRSVLADLAVNLPVHTGTGLLAGWLAACDSAPFNVIQFARPTPILLKSGSRKTRGGAGMLDLPL